MSKAEILAELPKLSEEDCFDIFEQLWRLEETTTPTARETALLTEAQARSEVSPSAGSPWCEVEARRTYGGNTPYLFLPTAI